MQSVMRKCQILSPPCFLQTNDRDIPPFSYLNPGLHVYITAIPAVRGPRREMLNTEFGKYGGEGHSEKKTH